ncbi:class I SAM-dependent methyltransferase [Paenibacillus sp. TRM 82003]|uniref:class I SAM-dependent methyltransferase n=1 Tax=Kineococcus sp. TRM81007 TaxID=2925831 RepID=UPI001F56C54D|nr:class I SAM-dependent methyltransferase [Kineococcus sp. TRM81007]MCI2238352.1 class I SAM-dependent methyltransferase [Kineococcus sp. TRM81007]MCI3922136.1 class I SAM-dependent methyltransferase [Paenibacillus sp. TRM 82003]
MAAVGQRALAWCGEWNRGHPWDHNAHHHGWIERHLPSRINAALDIGCGTGDLVRRLSRRAGHVTGLDADPASIDTARRLLHEQGNVDFRCEDLLSADLPGGYDVITALAVLHHVPFEPALSRLRDLLAPGGTLVVLGVYREEEPSDHLLSAAAVPANLVMGTVKTLQRRSSQRPIAMSAPAAPTTTTLREIRDIANRQTPRASLRRHLFWRYSLRYTAAPDASR